MITAVPGSINYGLQSLFLFETGLETLSQRSSFNLQNSVSNKFSLEVYTRIED